MSATSRRLMGQVASGRRVWTRSIALAGAALLTVALLPATGRAEQTSIQTEFLSAVGPVSADTGFPTYVQDSNGLRLQHCLDGSLLCGAAESPLPDPTQPISFPGNFPEESFFFNATAKATLPLGGNALFVGTIEAGFSGGEPAQGHQHMLNRIRLRIDTPQAGHYTVTHPYGVDEFDVPAGGDRSINFTEDIGIADGVFDGVLDGRVDPFLTWDTGLVSGADGGEYVGDPGVDHAVTGSPFGTNFFRIDGPNIGGGGVNTFTIPLFSLVGKVATNSSVDPGHPTYSRTDTSGGMVDVLASTDPNKSVRAKLPNAVSSTSLRGGPDGDYVARLPFTGATPPTSVTVSNTSDTPDAVFTPAVTDLVTTTEATYDADQKSLTVTAASSDQAVPPTLTAIGFGDLGAGTQVVAPATANPVASRFSAVTASRQAATPPPTLSGDVVVGTETFTDVEAPPEVVTVTSSAGGSDTEVVKVVGAAFPSDPVSADAGPDQTVQQGQTVTLDGTQSLNTTSMAWVQTSGPAVTLTGADGAVATFTAPQTETTLGFQLIAQGPGGPATDDVIITVASVTKPVANAGPDQNVLVDDTVVLDGTASTGAATFAWSQVSGTQVTLTGADTPHPTFVMPVGTLVFQLDVSGPGGSAGDLVSITSTSDVLAITRAEYRPDKAEWRIEGTSSITNNNTVTVHLGSTTAGQIIGTGLVDVTGAWTVRVRNSPVLPIGTTVTIESSRGGLLAGVFFTIH
ncbi:MAG TPA: hypothetical protein VFX70_15470 [Mycobacteriales bacterium]|nr:hypothetical protein [Mycobacteriales bacterium]